MHNLFTKSFFYLIFCSPMLGTAQGLTPQNLIEEVKRSYASLSNYTDKTKTSIVYRSSQGSHSNLEETQLAFDHLGNFYFQGFKLAEKGDKPVIYRFRKDLVSPLGTFRRSYREQEKVFEDSIPGAIEGLGFLGGNVISIPTSLMIRSLAKKGSSLDSMDQQTVLNDQVFSGQDCYTLQLKKSYILPPEVVERQKAMQAEVSSLHPDTKGSIAKSYQLTLVFYVRKDDLLIVGRRETMKFDMGLEIESLTNIEPKVNVKQLVNYVRE